MECENKCLLDLESNEDNIAMAQLQREIAKLVTDTTSTLLIHDGKIAELCLYIKTNLSNTLRELVDSMLTSGELETIIRDTLTGLGVLLDKAVEDIDNLKDQINSNMKFYLPNGKDYSYGQFMMLGTTESKACLFDLGELEDANYNLAYLKSKLGKKKLDYVFISHYHGDHIGGLETFEELYSNKTKFYIAKDAYSFMDNVEYFPMYNARNSVINYLNTKGYEYVEVNSELVVNLEDKIKLTILNNSDESFGYYQSIGTSDYNNYSFVIDCEIDNKHALIGFDGAEHTQKYLLKKGQVTKTDVLFNFHHGNYNKCNREYMLKLNPNIVVDTLPPVNMANFDGAESYTERPFYNAMLLSNARDEVILSVNAYSVEVEKGNTKVNSIRNHGNVEVYLNPDYKGNECIGTIDKPFKTFNQIFELIPKSCQTVTVNVSGKRIKTNQRFFNTFNKLIIKGTSSNKTELYDFQIDNCHKVEISNIKFVDETVYLFNSDVRFTDCDFKQTQERNVEITNSKVSFNDCTFTGASRECIDATDKSEVRLNRCTLNAPKYGINTFASILYINENTINGTKDYYRLDGDSQLIALRTGNTSERPELGESYYCNGYTYYDSEIEKLIYYVYNSPTHWKDLMGNDV